MPIRDVSPDRRSTFVRVAGTLRLSVAPIFHCQSIAARHQRYLLLLIPLESEVENDLDTISCGNVPATLEIYI